MGCVVGVPIALAFWLFVLTVGGWEAVAKVAILSSLVLLVLVVVDDLERRRV